MKLIKNNKNYKKVVDYDTEFVFILFWMLYFTYDTYFSSKTLLLILLIN